jgi:regulator of protease activity HflC (stomatin/prohibitin superfamily)
MEQSTQKNGLVNLIALLVVGAAGLTVATLADSLAGQVSTVFIAIGTLVAAVGWFQSRLEENERLEKLEFDELLKSRSGSALFESKDAESFPAQRSREQFERFLVPIFTALLFLLEAAAAYLLWRWLLKGPRTLELRQPTVALALFGLFALVLFLLGKFSATLARLQHRRLLRPGANWLLLGAYLCFIVALGIVGVEAGFPKADFYVALVLCGLLGLIATESLISLILEMYRPRVKGKAERPLYESRLVGLLGQPEGLITTAAQALDYQFGFKVSETWFFRLLQRHLLTLVAAQLAVLLISTAVVFIEPGEQAVLERFGKPVAGREVLGPGAHLKLPWPIDSVYRYRTEQIQTFDVGYVPDAQSEQLRTILWTVPHTKEENFLVANRATATVDTGEPEGARKAPPVSLLTVSIPVQYQITNVLEWAYRNSGPTNLLQDLATREVVRYLVSVDLNEIMSRKRLAAAELLRGRIQEAASARRLGARIFFVGLQDIHPPVKVAPDYERVVSAAQSAKSNILAAVADEIRTNALAGAQAFTITNRALALERQLEVASLAHAALFTNQIPAFDAAPSVYRQRAYFQTFARATADARKYILLTTNTADVIVFDLQDKIREDLLNLNVTPAKTK